MIPTSISSTSNYFTQSFSSESLNGDFSSQKNETTPEEFYCSFVDEYLEDLSKESPESLSGKFQRKYDPSFISKAEALFEAQFPNQRIDLKRVQEIYLRKVIRYGNITYGISQTKSDHLPGQENRLGILYKNALEQHILKMYKGFKSAIEHDFKGQQIHFSNSEITNLIQKDLVELYQNIIFDQMESNGESLKGDVVQELRAIPMPQRQDILNRMINDKTSKNLDALIWFTPYFQEICTKVGIQPESPKLISPELHEAVLESIKEKFIDKFTYSSTKNRFVREENSSNLLINSSVNSKVASEEKKNRILDEAKKQIVKAIDDSLLTQKDPIQREAMIRSIESDLDYLCNYINSCSAVIEQEGSVKLEAQDRLMIYSHIQSQLPILKQQI